MCTVTVVPCDGLVRIVHNRDELRTRPAALPPRIKQSGAHAAILPLDPESGGTWVAVTDCGFALAVLNVNERPMPRRSAHHPSRGLIIPALLDCPSLDAAVARALQWRSDSPAPHRLVVVDLEAVAQIIVREGETRTVHRRPLTGPVLFTSSGLGDALVRGPRRRLFRRQFAASGDRSTRQDAFHRHRWPDHPELSVRMSRLDAKTVSTTTIEIRPDLVTLAYDDPDEPAARTSISLPRQIQATT